MNEYQDQATWYEAQRKSGPNYGWITLLDADTREQAEDDLLASYGATVDDPGFRVIRKRGLDS